MVTFRTLVGEGILKDEMCPRCFTPMLLREFSDGATDVICSVSEYHDGLMCKSLGHSGEYSEDHCTLCQAPTQWVRVEVSEGRAYTYKAFEEPPLERGEWVRTPGNTVQREPFPGLVLRVLDGPSPDYPGPYKAVLGRLL